MLTKLLRVIALIGAVALLIEAAVDSFPLADRQGGQLWVLLLLAGGVALYWGCARRARRLFRFDLLVPPALCLVTLRVLPLVLLPMPAALTNDVFLAFDLFNIAVALSGTLFAVVLVLALFTAWEIAAIHGVVRGDSNLLTSSLRMSWKMTLRAVLGLAVGALVGLVLFAGIMFTTFDVLPHTLARALCLVVALVWNLVTATLLLRMLDPDKQHRLGVRAALVEGWRMKWRWLVPTLTMMVLLGCLTHWSSDYTVVDYGETRTDESAHGELRRHQYVPSSTTVTRTEQSKWEVNYQWTGGFEVDSAWLPVHAEVNDVVPVTLFVGVAAWFLMLAMILYKLQIAVGLAGRQSEHEASASPDDGSAGNAVPPAPALLLVIACGVLTGCGSESTSTKRGPFEQVHYKFQSVQDGRFHVRHARSSSWKISEHTRAWPSHLSFSGDDWRAPGLDPESGFELCASRDASFAFECRLRDAREEDSERRETGHAGSLRVDLTAGEPCFLHLGFGPRESSKGEKYVELHLIGALSVPDATGVLEWVRTDKISETVSAHVLRMPLLPASSSKRFPEPVVLRRLMGNWDVWFSGELGASFPILHAVDVTPFAGGGWGMSGGTGGETLTTDRATITNTTGWPQIIVDGEKIEGVSAWPGLPGTSVRRLRNARLWFDPGAYRRGRCT